MLSSEFGFGVPSTCSRIWQLDGELNVKVGDFGLSVLLKEGQLLPPTAAGEVLPIKWMAPEILCTRSAYAAPCDIWSLGVTMIEIFKGQVCIDCYQ